VQGPNTFGSCVSITLLRNRYLRQSTTETGFFDEGCTTQRAKLIKWMRMRRTAHRVISMSRSNRVALKQGGYQFRCVKLPGLRVYGLAEDHTPYGDSHALPDGI
jgi:hypothetical protein